MEKFNSTKLILKSIEISRSDTVGPKYRLGKIKSKYLILEILAFSNFIGNASSLLYDSCRTRRALLVGNPQVATRILGPGEPVSLEFFTHTEERSELLF